jgi:transposase-like protein
MCRVWHIRRVLDKPLNKLMRWTRQRERRMPGFKSPGQAQRFLAAYGPIASHFRPRRHLFPLENTASR